MSYYIRSNINVPFLILHFLETRACWWCTVTGCVTRPGPRSPRMSSAHARASLSRVPAWPVQTMTRAPASVLRRHVITPRVQRPRASHLTPARVSARLWRLTAPGLCSGPRSSAPAPSYSLQRSSSVWSLQSKSFSLWRYSTATLSITAKLLTCR